MLFMPQHCSIAILQINVIASLSSFFISYYAKYFISYRPPDRVTGEYGYEVSFMGQLVTAMHGTYATDGRCLAETIVDFIKNIIFIKFKILQSFFLIIC